jgi:hypothetical protein
VLQAIRVSTRHGNYSFFLIPLLLHFFQSEVVKGCCELLLDAAQEALSGVDDLLGGSAPLHGTEPKLNIFKNSLDRVFRSTSYSGSDYKVYISDESPKKSERYSSSVLASFSNAKKIRTVHYWCFSTGIALMELKSLGIKSFILTSGF